MTSYQRRVFLEMCVTLLLTISGLLYMYGVFDEASTRVGVIVIALIAYFLCVIPTYFYVKTTINENELKKI